MSQEKKHTQQNTGLWLGQWLPVILKDQHKCDFLYAPMDYASLLAQHVTVSMIAKQTRLLIDQLGTLVMNPVLPAHSRGKVKATFVLGANYHASGISLRPQFPYQKEVAEWLLMKFLKRWGFEQFWLCSPHGHATNCIITFTWGNLQHISRKFAKRHENLQGKATTW